MSKKTLKASPQYVDLSRWNFAAWWVLILAVHLVTGGYNALFAVVYTELKHTYLYRCLEYSNIGMLAKDHPVIANVNVVMAALHGWCVLEMVGSSLRRCELCFSWSSPRRDKSQTKISPYNSKTDTERPRLIRLYSRVIGRRGLLGVDGSNFHEILLAREFLETSLQTRQAYRMSWLLPRMAVNRFYLILVTLNCWSSVLVYSLLFRRNEARKRLAYLVCDCALNLVSCIGVPLAVALSYVDEYDTNLTGFPLVKWYDDEWSARVLNEFQMVFVVSWLDLLQRTIFSLGVITTTSHLKDLLRRTNARSKEINSFVAVTSSEDKRPRDVKTRARREILNVSYVIFAVWGLVVIALHVQASIQPQQPQCVLQVRPWAVSSPACYLAVLDCYHLGISGKADEVEAKWSEFNRASVVTLVIRHCPTLGIPDSIGDFRITTGIKVYNSTITEWGASAAITNTNHPELIWFYLVRVHLTDGILPEGVLSTDFPGNLYDLEFTYTNVRELPDDLDSKWLIGTTVYFEYSELTSIPSSLLRLEPYSISFTGSPVAELPTELFEVAGMVYLYMGSIAIQELPSNVTNFSPGLAYVYFTDTNVSFFWSWIDPLVERTLEQSPAPLLMGGSTYCTELAEITSGAAQTFSVLPSDEYSSILTDPKQHLDVILHTVNCDLENAAPVYPIDFEDSISALK